MFGPVTSKSDFFEFNFVSLGMNGLSSYNSFPALRLPYTIGCLKSHKSIVPHPFLAEVNFGRHIGPVYVELATANAERTSSSEMTYRAGCHSFLFS